MILRTRRRSDGGHQVLYNLSGNEAYRRWDAKGDARGSSLDLSLVFSEIGPRSTVREEGEMSYCRLGPECDIYCYYHVGGYYEVWSGAGEHQFKTAKETVAFLRERREAGDKVPDHVFENLSEERK